MSRYSERLLESEGESILENTRKALAALVGSQTEEIVFTDNTTRGVEIALSMALFAHGGVSVTNGEILLTTQEHDAVRYCCEHMARLSGARLKYVDVRDLEENAIPKAIAEKVSKRTRVVVVSHVTYSTGQILDVGEVSREVRTRARSLGVNEPPAVVVDGAQAVGQIPVDVHALGCDFYAADGHKWLLGPPGSGFVYVAKRLLQDGGRSIPVFRTYMLAPKYRPKDEGGRAYEPATMNISPIAGLERAIGALGSPGSPKEFRPISKQIQERTDEFRELLLSELAGLNVVLNGDAPGMVFLSFDGLPSESKDVLYSDLREQLEKHFGVVCRSIESPPCLRFCVHFFVSPEELRIAVMALKRLLEFDYQEISASLRESRDELVRRKKAMESLDELKALTLSRAREHLSEYSNVLRTKYEKALIQLPAKFMERARDMFAEKRSLVSALEKSVEEAIENATSPDEVIDQEQRVLAELRKALEGYDEA